MHIFCSWSWRSLSLIRVSYFNKKLRKDKFQFWWLRHKMGCRQFLTDFVNLDKIWHKFWKKNLSGSKCRKFWKKLFLSGVIVSVNKRRKETKVTFVSFGLHAGRLTAECKKYGNKLFSHFDIFIYFSPNCTLDSRITEYLQCHIGLQLHIYFINFDFVKFWENWEKEF